MSGGATVHSLHGNQMKAVAPAETVWLSASAGTGKTQVLSSRVLRLLLQPDVEPSQILCLTFTRAGATEMAERINSKLASWVRMDDVALAMQLQAIGADFHQRSLDRARTLFASVLDCPGGGLRIDTIHAFAQWLLGAFPHEAGLAPGTRAMEDRERALLLRQVLSDLLVEAGGPNGDPQLLDALSDLSLRMGGDEIMSYLLRCAEAREAWFGPGGWQEPLRQRVNQLLGLPANADETDVAALCTDQAFDVASLRRCMEINAAWKAKTGQDAAGAIGDWLSASAQGRRGGIDALSAVFMTKGGGLRSTSSQEKIDPDYAGYVARVADCLAKVRDQQALLALADRLVPALRLGRAFALKWDEAKQREGLIDFDDQIRRAAELLNTSAIADWIRYKMDRRFDHILVDEAQDTNAAQWRIIDALTGDFFAGAGQRGDVMRTLFVVGDYKQAIFRFQGTSPENFEAARRNVREKMAGAFANTLENRGNSYARPLLELGLERSFRTAQPVLDFVDGAIRIIGPENFGLEESPEFHVGLERPGYVAMWRPVGERSEADAEADEDEEGAEGWLSRPDRQMAERIARQVKGWIDRGFPLRKGAPRAAGPGDVMVLVRKRRELAGLIVARLHAAGVPVAGVDRLRLGAPLAVRDLVSALRFAAQPLDDLNLAALLVSPLVGWTQEQLLDHGYRETVVRDDGRSTKAESLWYHLRRQSNPAVAAAVEQLIDLLARADYEPPQALLHWLLVGPWQGRRKLVARLGRDANDPIDELLNAAHAYSMSSTPSLVGFLNWFDAGEGELKREAGSGEGLVRVMTVHGSKGLQAPIVILADATGDPEKGRGISLDLPDPMAPETRAIPLPSLRKEERVGRVAEQYARARLAEEQEHWRLLYVAMTRAEEALFIGGPLGAREKTPAGNSWYAKLRDVFGNEEWVEDPIWGARLEWGECPEAVKSRPAMVELPLPEPLPRWLSTPVGPEPRPPRPLAPSSLGEDVAPDPPYPPGAGAQSARRGTLVHKLLERLPEVEPGRREQAGASWLARNARDLDESAQRSLLADALVVLANPDWAELFSPAGLAEVPIAAVIGDRVVAGTIDRLLVEPDRVRIVDFKTARRPPEGLDEVSCAVLRQMAAYVAALEVTWPERKIEAALLYTAAPRLIEITPEVLALHKAALTAPQ